jgi:hypothetical protein
VVYVGHDDTGLVITDVRWIRQTMMQLIPLTAWLCGCSLFQIILFLEWIDPFRLETENLRSQFLKPLDVGPKKFRNWREIRPTFEFCNRYAPH